MSFETSSLKSHNQHSLVFCTYPSVYSLIVLKDLINSNNIQIKGIIYSNRSLRYGGSALTNVFYTIRLTGFHYATYLFSVTSLFWGLFGLLCNLKGVYRKIFSRDDLALTLWHQIRGIRSHVTHDINDAVSREFLETCQADGILAAHFNQLIKPEILQRYPGRCWNIHPSILPAYQGVDPAFYALNNQELNTGVSLHVMSDKFDQGEVVASKSVAVDKQESVFGLNCRLFKAGAALVLNPANGIANTDQQLARYDSWPTPELVAGFKKQGYKLLPIKSYIKTLFELAGS